MKRRFVYRKSALLLVGGVVVVAAVGCASGGRSADLGAGPTPQRGEPGGPVLVPAPPQTAADSAADEAALQALQDLEFSSLSKGAEHVRGFLPASAAAFDALVDEEAGRLVGPRGGAASLAPVYDIDVESFADYDRVQYYVNFFLGPSRDRFEIWLGRLARYEGMIRSRFRALGVPEDMVYLGLIESGYSNTAVSRSNAVGMWQFIRSTAQLYDLEVNTWVDERRDPFKATDAAGRYLAELNQTFGSWYLAAAAYNGGEGRVSRGLRRLRYDVASLTDAAFFDLSNRRYLVRETRDYVPKLIAAAMIAKDPLRYGFDSIPYLESLVFDEIALPDQTGLDVLARLADTTTRTLEDLNPQYIRGVTPPGRETIVRVPRGTGRSVIERYAELPPAERVSFVEHVVARGETLSEIGGRYRVSVTLLRAANGNVNPRRLRVGQRLVIPISADARARAARGDAPQPRGPAVLRHHIVRRGDTLWRISRRYGVTITQLRRWNSIWGDQVLNVGQRVQVSGL
jgi:membrane-bound lytic murein transglycosylase D